MLAFYALDARSSLFSVLTRWSIPVRTHRLTSTRSSEAYVKTNRNTQYRYISNRCQNSFNVTMDPQKGHDLAKLSTCTTCEMAEDFSKSSRKE
jgi:hypothetical protein